MNTEPGQYSADDYIDAALKEQKIIVKAFAATIEELQCENETLRRGFTGDYDLDSWLDFAKEKQEIQRQNNELVAKLSRIENAALVTRSDNCAEDVIDRIHLALAEPESQSLQHIQDEAALEMANYLYKNGYTLNTAVEAAEEHLAKLRQQSTSDGSDGDE